MKKFASQLQGLDINQFNSCFENKRYESFIDKDIALSNSLGFTETPSFIIMNTSGSNQQKIEGPKPFPFFQVAIENLENGRKLIISIIFFVVII
jgi:protein-disulfide isomerase